MNNRLLILLIALLFSLDVLAVVDPQVAIGTAKSEIRQIMAAILGALVAIGIAAALVFVGASSLRWLRKSA